MVKAGYKQTEVGVIPEGWDVKKLREFISLQRGHDLTERERRPGNVPVMGSAGQNGFHDTYLVEGPGLTVGRSGASFGKVHYCAENYWPHNTALFATDFQQNDPLFSFYFLTALDFDRYNTGGAQPSLNRNFIYPILIGVPKLDEQRAIAEALSDVDGLIAGLDKLIAKKRDVKTAVMQVLLTGEKRLPGFGNGRSYKQTEIGMIPSDWNLSCLGDAVDFLDGQRKPIKESDRAKMRGIYPYYGASGIVDYVNDYLFDDDLILLGEDGENILSRHTQLAFRVKGKIWVNNHAHVLKAKLEYDTGYLTEYLESLDYSLYNSGTAQPKLNKQTCTKIPVLQPSKAEQCAIAETLSDMDAEITALETRRAKTQVIKQGMMQELLTGKTRLGKKFNF